MNSTYSTASSYTPRNLRTNDDQSCCSYGSERSFGFDCSNDKRQAVSPSPLRASRGQQGGKIERNSYSNDSGGMRKYNSSDELPPRPNSSRQSYNDNNIGPPDASPVQRPASAAAASTRGIDCSDGAEQRRPSVSRTGRRWSTEILDRNKPDPAFPNPVFLNADGFEKVTPREDSAPMYSSLTANKEFPFYTCVDCQRSLPACRFTRSALAKHFGGGRLGRATQAGVNAYKPSDDWARSRNKCWSDVRCGVCTTRREAARSGARQAAAESEGAALMNATSRGKTKPEEVASGATSGAKDTDPAMPSIERSRVPSKKKKVTTTGRSTTSSAHPVAAAVIQVRQQQTAAPVTNRPEAVPSRLAPHHVYKPEDDLKARAKELMQGHKSSGQRAQPPPAQATPLKVWEGTVRVESTAAATKWHSELLQNRKGL